MEISISFGASFVLAHRDDEQLPVEAFSARIIQSCPEVEVESKSLTRCVLLAENCFVPQCKQQIADIFLAQGIGENDATISLKVASPADDTPEEPKPEQEAAEENGTKIKRITEALVKSEGLDKPMKSAANIQALIGATSLKELSQEITKVAPHMLFHKSHSAFAAQCYLFSIGDCCGLSSCLSLLADQIKELKLYEFPSSTKVAEITAGIALEEVYTALKEVNSRGMLVCIDISIWLDRVGSREFRMFLKQLATMRKGRIFAFRIPFVDEETRLDVQRILSDVFFVREVMFPPFSMQELRQYATVLLGSFGMAMEESAWNVFDAKVIAEKSDGCFYGLQTIKKVTDEIIYKKHLCDSEDIDSKGALIITGQDIASLLEQADATNAMDQLDKMIGIESVRERILDFIAQIEFVKKSTDMERPCLHMQFLGGPGTGKTAIARILGKLLKERGLLSKGLFFEYAGRDLCGQFIGETAPKTAAICRDAYGSVLFIDEAYSLFRSTEDTRDYGREAVDTLIAQMENHREDLIVIMAGYEADMETLLQANAGLASRIPYSIVFSNYAGQELFEIFMSMVEGKFDFDDGFKKAAQEYFLGLPKDMIESKDFANARFVRNLFERTWGKAASRRQMEPDVPLMLMECDFDKATAESEFSSLQKRKRPRLGFI